MSPGKPASPLPRTFNPPVLARWQPLLRLRAAHFLLQCTKTKWRSCNHTARTIRLNTELAKKPVEGLEYIVAHELVHPLEPTHNARFLAAMDRLLPNWPFHRQVLNRLAVRQEKWAY